VHDRSAVAPCFRWRTTVVSGGALRSRLIQIWPSQLQIDVKSTFDIIECERLDSPSSLLQFLYPLVEGFAKLRPGEAPPHILFEPVIATTLKLLQLVDESLIGTLDPEMLRPTDLESPPGEALECLAKVSLEV